MKPTILVAFQRALISHREAAGWTRTELARRLGLKHMERVIELETGSRVPKLDTAANVAKVFGKSLGEFLSRNPCADQID